MKPACITLPVVKQLVTLHRMVDAGLLKVKKRLDGGQDHYYAIARAPPATSPAQDGAPAPSKRIRTADGSRSMVAPIGTADAQAIRTASQLGTAVSGKVRRTNGQAYN